MREERGEDPQVLRGLAAENGADGFAHRPHGEVAAEHAEQQHETGDDDTRASAPFTGNHGGLSGSRRGALRVCSSAAILGIRSVAGQRIQVGQIDLSGRAE